MGLVVVSCWDSGSFLFIALPHQHSHLSPCSIRVWHNNMYRAAWHQATSSSQTHWAWNLMAFTIRSGNCWGHLKKWSTLGTSHQCGFKLGYCSLHLSLKHLVDLNLLWWSASPKVMPRKSKSLSSDYNSHISPSNQTDTNKEEDQDLPLFCLSSPEYSSTGKPQE